MDSTGRDRPVCFFGDQVPCVHDGRRMLAKQGLLGAGLEHCREG